MIHPINSSITLVMIVLLANPLFADLFGTGQNQFAMDFVQIGNPGNANDIHGLGYGAVTYDYRLGSYEISRAMIIAANNEGSLGITLADMSGFGGNGANRPATGVSWNEAARFVNWMNTSSGYQVAYHFTTSGIMDNISLWTSANAWQRGGENLFRHKNAHYFLPNEDEWYKAAYYDSSINAYFDYATVSDTVPTAVAAGTNSGTAVYDNAGSGPADITNAGGLSPYGTMGQNGNVWEWTESGVTAPNDSPAEGRVQRSGSWNSSSGFLLADHRSYSSPDGEFEIVGFRVASVPEPSGLLLLLVVAVGLLAKRRRRS